MWSDEQEAQDSRRAGNGSKRVPVDGATPVQQELLLRWIPHQPQIRPDGSTLRPGVSLKENRRKCLVN
jgi:hypothetical protein